MDNAANSIKYAAPAEINRFLHVTAKRDDGYHEIETVFQFLEFSDTLKFTLIDTHEIIREGNHDYCSYDDDLIVRAAKLIQLAAEKRRSDKKEQSILNRLNPPNAGSEMNSADELGSTTNNPRRSTTDSLGVRISIEKKIPPGSGLGGGSSNAATTLIALNELWNVGLHRDELMAMGLTLGADVPVFVYGQSCWATGIGEQLEAYPLDEHWYCIAIPAVHVSTQEIFSHPELERNRPALKKNLIRTDDDFENKTANALQAVTTKLYPKVAETIRLLQQHGPTRMSGSGSAVFLRCESQLMAQRIAQGLPDGIAGFATRSLNHHPHLNNR